MADSLEDIEARTDARAAKPQSVSADGISVTQRSVQDEIALEKHRANTIAARSGRIGVGFFKTKPPGAT